MRLDKAVALSGISRRDAKNALSAGRVCVNGQPVRDAGLILKEDDTVTLDGRELRAETTLHLMLNKPAGCITATEDAHGERTVLDLIPPALRLKGLGPVGRLDKDVTGLVFLTTDGQLAHRLISPKRGVEKQYTALVEGTPDEECVKRFAEGIRLKDFEALPARLEIAEKGSESSLCRVFVSEGKYHQVKRMLGAVGHPVLRLRRDSIAGVKLDTSLAEGEFRRLTPQEIAALYKAAGMEKA